MEFERRMRGREREKANIERQKKGTREIVKNKWNVSLRQNMNRKAGERMEERAIKKKLLKDNVKARTSYETLVSRFQGQWIILLVFLSRSLFFFIIVQSRGFML